MYCSRGSALTYLNLNKIGVLIMNKNFRHGMVVGLVIGCGLSLLVGSIISSVVCGIACVVVSPYICFK